MFATLRSDDTGDRRRARGLAVAPAVTRLGVVVGTRLEATCVTDLADTTIIARALTLEGHAREDRASRPRERLHVRQCSRVFRIRAPSRPGSGCEAGGAAPSPGC